jgi:WD40 repeat protein
VQTWKSDSLYHPSNDRRWWFLGPGNQEDRRQRLFDVVNKEIQLLPLLTRVPASRFESQAAFSPDSKLLFVVSDATEQQALDLWDLEARSVRGRLAGAQLAATASNDGNFIAAALVTTATETPIGIFDRRTLDLKQTLRPAAPGEVQELSFTSDDRYLVAGLSVPEDTISLPSYPSRLVRVWEVTSGQQVLTLDRVDARCAMGSGSEVILMRSQKNDQLLEWHDVADGTQRLVLRAVRQPSPAILRWPVVAFEPTSISPNRQQVALAQPQFDRDLLEQLAVKWDVSSFYYQSSGFRCQVCETRSGRSRGEIAGINPSWSSDGRILATCLDGKHHIALWNIPLRKSLTWFAAGAALLALPIALLARRRCRPFRAGIVSARSLPANETPVAHAAGSTDLP